MSPSMIGKHRSTSFISGIHIYAVMTFCQYISVVNYSPSVLVNGLGKVKRNAEKEKCNQTAFVFSGELASGRNLSPNITKCETSTRIGSIGFY